MTGTPATTTSEPLISSVSKQHAEWTPATGGKIISVVLKQRISDSKGSFGWDATKVWVDGGLRAYFTVTQEVAAPAAADDTAVRAAANYKAIVSAGITSARSMLNRVRSGYDYDNPIPASIVDIGPPDDAAAKADPATATLYSQLQGLIEDIDASRAAGRIRAEARQSTSTPGGGGADAPPSWWSSPPSWLTQPPAQPAPSGGYAPSGVTGPQGQTGTQAGQGAFSFLGPADPYSGITEMMSPQPYSAATLVTPGGGSGSSFVIPAGTPAYEEDLKEPKPKGKVSPAALAGIVVVAGVLGWWVLKRRKGRGAGSSIRKSFPFGAA